MTILNVLLLLSMVIFSLVNGVRDPMYKPGFELGKPLVVPAAEADYHYTMIEVDTWAGGGQHQPLYGLIGVMLLDGVFTFSGIEETYLRKDNLIKRDPHLCMPFKGINVVHKCGFEYFVLNADFVDIQKTVFRRDHTFETVCKEPNDRRKNAFDHSKDKYNLVVRYGNRVLMAYKEGANRKKCIGTYDVEGDYFTCVREDKSGNLVGFQLESFLHDNLTGEPHRDDNTVEVFCKLPHIYNPKS